MEAEPPMTKESKFCRSDFTLLPDIADLLKSIQSQAKAGNNTDMKLMTERLSQKFARCIDKINTLPGLEMTPSEQLQRTALLEENLRKKKEMMSNPDFLVNFDDADVGPNANATGEDKMDTT